VSEITVILKDESRSYKQDFLIYEKYTVSEDDPIIVKCKEDALKNFQGRPQSIAIKIHLQIE
jgi:hypothetical protein